MVSWRKKRNSQSFSYCSNGFLLTKWKRVLLQKSVNQLPSPSSLLVAQELLPFLSLVWRERASKQEGEALKWRDGATTELKWSERLIIAPVWGEKKKVSFFTRLRLFRGPCSFGFLFLHNIFSTIHFLHMLYLLYNLLCFGLFLDHRFPFLKWKGK